MSGNLKILSAAILYVVLLTQDKVCNHLGLGQLAYQEKSTVAEYGEELNDVDTALNLRDDSSANEPTYRWNEQLRDWTIVEEAREFQAQLASYSSTDQSSLAPIEIDWITLIDIDYKLKYFKELEMEVYAPVFTKAVEALHKKEVIIEGFVIPFEAEEEILSLSFNPFASCFFCGKASPASVMSLYLKDKGKRYKMDDFKKFSGTLYLNHDDPNEFYYILRDAKEVKG